MNAKAIVDQLDEQKLREHIDQLDAERKAAIVLLRSARAKRISLQRSKPAAKVGAPRDQAGQKEPAE